MKVSLNWVKSFTDIKVPQDKLIELIGQRLGAIDEMIDWGGRYDNIYVAKVIACEPHPNSDKLKLCNIDDGGVVKKVKRDENGHVQVVCGAPNVAAGQTVAWLAPGASVPSTYDSEPLVVEVRKIRDVTSNGMIGSAKELALSQDHEGILVLDDKLKAGKPLKSLFDLDDTIIDIENKMFTHRPDAFGMLGVAREIAGIQHQAFKSPDWYLEAATLPVASSTLPLAVRNDAPKLVPRFMAVALSGVEVGPSPVWLQSYLTRLGIRPVNNVVDLTNYHMFLTAQPLHAYDYDKLLALDGGKAATLVARTAKAGEKVRLLDGKEHAVKEGTIVIASQKALVGIGGVMGAANTEVSETTKNIVLECANFDMYAVRRASMAHGIFTEAVTRFNKGQSPLQNELVLAHAIEDIHQITHGAIASKLFDVGQRRAPVHTVKVSAEFINQRLGLKITAAAMQRLLQNVEFVVGLDGENLKVTPPFWRTDIHIPEDVVEEVGRLYGYDQLPLELPQRDLKAAPRDELFDFKQQVRECLSRAGANEVLTYSFVHSDLMKKVGQDPEHAYEIANALSPDLQYYRTGLTPSLLDKVHMNIKAGFDQFALFELGKVHYKGEMDANDPGVPNEDNHVALVVAYDDRQKPMGAAYYSARKFLEQIASELTNNLVLLADFDLRKDEWGRQLTAPYEPQRSAVIVKDDQIWGVVGEYRTPVQQALKLPVYCGGFEINLGVLNDTTTTYQPLPRFPKVTQDITLKAPTKLSFGEILGKVKHELGKLAPSNSHWQFDTVGIYQPPRDQAHKNVTFRLEIASHERTLQTEEVNKLLDQVAAATKRDLKAERV